MSFGKTSVALYQLGYDPNRHHDVRRSTDILNDLELCKKFLSYAVPDEEHSDKNAPYRVDQLIRVHAGMPALTKAEFFGTGKEAPMATKEKAKPGRKAKFSKIKLVGLDKSHKKRGFNEGSLRARCFDLVKNNMAITDYVKAASKKRINKAQANGALSKMAGDGIVKLVA
tara:strand:+ start:317 stop:826 length:510 start_codon:yes stop_codon:yes gene_type:complete